MLTQDGSSTCEKVAAQLRIFLRLRIVFSYRYFERSCLSRLILFLLTKLRDNVTDAGLAISLSNALQDVLDTVDHLLGCPSVYASLNCS